MPEWTGEAARLMHLHSIKVKDLAKEVGWARPYVSEILHGRRTNSRAETAIMSAINAIIERKESE